MDPSSQDPDATVVDLCDPSIRIEGMDCIWHNMYADPADHAFTTFHKWSSEDLDTMYQIVAKHIKLGLYRLISINASKHSFVVVCASEKDLSDFPEDCWDL